MNPSLSACRLPTGRQGRQARQCPFCRSNLSILAFCDLITYDCEILLLRNERLLRKKRLTFGKRARNDVGG